MSGGRQVAKGISEVQGFSPATLSAPTHGKPQDPLGPSLAPSGMSIDLAAAYVSPIPSSPLGVRPEFQAFLLVCLKAVDQCIVGGVVVTERFRGQVLTECIIWGSSGDCSWSGKSVDDFKSHQGARMLA